MTVRDIDKGWKRIKASISEFAQFDVVMGWVEGKKENRDGDAGINNAGLAVVHEFGTSDGRIPEGRLGLREWADRSKREIGDQIESAYKRTIDGSPAKRELNKLGLWAVSDWRKYQRTVQPGPEIGDRREKQIIKEHGRRAFFRSKKLADTGQLLAGATHQVRRRVGR